MKKNRVMLLILSRSSSLETVKEPNDFGSGDFSPT